MATSDAWRTVLADLRKVMQGGGFQPWGQLATPEMQQFLTTPVDPTAVPPPPRPTPESTQQQISALEAAMASGQGAFAQGQLARGIGQQEVAGGELGEAAAYMTPVLGSLMAAGELYQDPTQRTPGRFIMETMPGAGDVRDLSRGLGGLFALQAAFRGSPQMKAITEFAKEPQSIDPPDRGCKPVFNVIIKEEDIKND